MDLTISDNAYTHIGNLLKEHDKKYVRLQVKGGGCAGFEYEWTFEDESDTDDHEWSYTNLKKWIETQEGIARAAGQVERSRSNEMSQKKRDAAMRKRLDAQAYIRTIKRYIRTGDWDGMYYGPHENKLTKWKIIAPAG